MDFMVKIQREESFKIFNVKPWRHTQSVDERGMADFPLALKTEFKLRGGISLWSPLAVKRDGGKALITAKLKRSWICRGKFEFKL